MCPVQCMCPVHGKENDLLLSLCSVHSSGIICGHFKSNPKRSSVPCCRRRLIGRCILKTEQPSPCVSADWYSQVFPVYCAVIECYLHLSVYHGTMACTNTDTHIFSAFICKASNRRFFCCGLIAIPQRAAQAVKVHNCTLWEYFELHPPCRPVCHPIHIFPPRPFYSIFNKAELSAKSMTNCLWPLPSSLIPYNFFLHTNFCCFFHLVNHNTDLPQCHTGAREQGGGGPRRPTQVDF